MRWRIILLTLWLASCGSDEKPKNLIDTQTMTDIMADVHLLEAEVNNLHFQHQDSAVFIYQTLKVKMLKKYNIDTATFRSSFRYYTLNPIQMKEVYAGVKNKLEKEKKKVEAATKVHKSPVPQIDSIKKKIDSLKNVNNRPPNDVLNKIQLPSISTFPKKTKSSKLTPKLP